LFVHWSNQDASYRDMESRELHCQRCNKDTQHTFRYHITKTKHYSVVSVGSGKKEITLVCHVCLLETSVDKNDSKELVKQYDNEIATGEANELMDKGKDSKAENKLRKVLKKDPEFPQALYSISKCLISQAKYGEAEFYIKILESKFPDIPEIKELRDSLPPKLDTVEPKPTLPKGSTPKSAEVKPSETVKPKPTLPKGSIPKPTIISGTKDSDVQDVTAVLNGKTNEDDSDDEDDFELCMEPECFLYQKGVEHTAEQHSPNKNSEKICNNCYHEEKYHDVFSINDNKRLCFGCKDDGLTVFCKEFSETSSNNKQVISNNDNILNEKDVVKSEDLEQLEEKLTKEIGDEEEVAEYLKLIEELQKEGLGNSNTLIEVKQMLVKDRRLDENNLQYLTELDIQLDKQVNEITKSVEKSEKDREKRQKELDAIKKVGEEEEKLKESKRRVDEAERELEEKKKKKEESHNNTDIDKQIAINEEKIRKIEEESKKLDEED